jgi:hypothetical protein
MKITLLGIVAILVLVAVAGLILLNATGPASKFSTMTKP